ncbi:DUF2726 domain-containing protein [Citrobacter cronae]|uniref:DUF2726 domain-containing protein n=1 Tax=Citrobacter cronae TaxID=1748967 RepID=UPI0021AD890A|nr:DUF2726 domain-containing protein [Citrobacter cronae]
MTLKYIIALAIFLTFVCFAAFILIYTGRTKREQQQTQLPLDEHDQQTDIIADTDEAAALDGISEYFIKKNTILPKVLMDLYVRLSVVFSGQYIIAPQVLARDLVELELEDEPVAPVDVLQAQQYADEFVFDFVLSDAHTGELVLAMINEDAISAQPEGEFIIALFKRAHIPVFRYETLSGLDDNALAVNIAESIDDGRFS